MLFCFLFIGLKYVYVMFNNILGDDVGVWLLYCIVGFVVLEKVCVVLWFLY